METLVSKTTNMLNELPKSEQELAYEFVKRLVLAWDPDFSKVTSSEKEDIEEAKKEYAKGDYVEYKFWCKKADSF